MWKNCVMSFMDGRLLRSVTRSLLPASTQYVDMCPRPPRPARGDHWGPVSLGTSPFWSFFVSHEYHLRSSILPNDPKLFVATDEYAVSVVCSDYICFKTEFQNHTFFDLRRRIMFLMSRRGTSGFFTDIVCLMPRVGQE